MAAILNTRTGYRNGTTSGWVARSLFSVGDNLYAVVLDTSSVKIRVYKGTGDGTWVEQDSANAPLHSGATDSYDAAMPLSGTAVGLIHVAYRTATTTVRVRRFDTATDTWESADVGGANAASTSDPTTGLSIAIRSDGDVLLIFTQLSPTRCYLVVYEGTAWSGTTNLRGNYNHILSTSMRGSTDNLHLFRKETVTTGIYRNIIAPDNTNSVSTSVDTTTAAQFSNFSAYASDAGADLTAVAFRDATGELDLGIEVDADLPTVVASITPTTVTDPGVMGSVLVAYNSQWHVIWSGNGRGEIHYDTSDDYASPVFGTDSTIVSGLSATDPAVYAIATATGVPVLYTDLTSPPSVDIVWAVGSPPAGSTDALGTVSEDTVAITGSTFTGSAGQGAVGTVSEDVVSVVGSSITGAAGQSATVAEDSIAIVGSALTGSAGQGSVGTVSEDIVPIEGFNLTGSAGQSAVVSEDSVAVTGAIITGSAGQRAEGTVLEGLVSITGGNITATAAGSDIATVFADTVPITGGVFTGTAGQGAVGTVSEGVVSLSGGIVEAGISFSALVSGSSVTLSGEPLAGASSVQATVDETVVSVSGTVITGGSSVLGSVLVDNIVISGSTISGSASVQANVETGTIVITGENISGFIVYNTGPMYGIFSYTDAITGELSYTEIFDGTLSGTFSAEEVVSALFSSE